MTLVWGDPAGFAVDWDAGSAAWPRGRLPGGVSSLGLTAGCSSMSCRPGRPASGGHRPRRAAGGGCRAAPRHSPRPGGATASLGG